MKSNETIDEESGEELSELSVIAMSDWEDVCELMNIATEIPFSVDGMTPTTEGVARRRLMIRHYRAALDWDHFMALEFGQDSDLWMYVDLLSAGGVRPFDFSDECSMLPSGGYEEMWGHSASVGVTFLPESLFDALHGIGDLEVSQIEGRPALEGEVEGWLLEFCFDGLILASEPWTEGGLRISLSEESVANSDLVDSPETCGW